MLGLFVRFFATSFCFILVVFPAEVQAGVRVNDPVEGLSLQDMTHERARQVVESDLEFMRSLVFSRWTRKAIAIFGPDRTGEALVQYFARHIRTIVYDGRPSSAMASWDHSAQSLIIRPEYLASSRLQRAGVLLHEARHASGGQALDHVSCPFPYVFSFNQSSFLIGREGKWSQSASCDKDDNGAYAVNATFFLNVFFFCENCSDEERKRAYVGFLKDGLVRITSAEAVQRLLGENWTKSDLAEVEQVIRENLAQLYPPQ